MTTAHKQANIVQRKSLIIRCSTRVLTRTQTKEESNAHQLSNGEKCERISSRTHDSGPVMNHLV